MEGIGRKRGPRPLVDQSAKVAVLAALREGRRLDEVAAAIGVTVQAFYSARRRDPLFAAGWKDAHALGAAAERSSLRRGGPGPRAADAGPETDGEERIAPNNRRLYQRRRMRHVRFDEKRQKIFLAHFCWSGDTLAAAAEAGVSERTVYGHRRRTPHFAAEFREALDQCYVRLEAEAVRQRLEAQLRLRRAMEESEPPGAPLPSGLAEEFERVMKLLARWDRRSRNAAVEQARPWTFEEAIVELDRCLDAFAIRQGIARPEPEAGDEGAGQE